MSAALYAGDCLIGSLEPLHELDDPFDARFAHYRFTPCAAFEAYKELLDPPDKKKRGTEKYFAAIDALDLRLVEDGREVRYRYVNIEGDMASFRVGSVRLSPAAEKEWRAQQAARRGTLRKLMDALMGWSAQGVGRHRP